MKIRLWYVCPSRQRWGTSNARTSARPPHLVDERDLGEDAVERERRSTVLAIERERRLGADGVAEIQLVALLAGDREVDLEDVGLGDRFVAAEADDARALGETVGADAEYIVHGDTVPYRSVEASPVGVMSA